jgi:hypothetical protein
LVVCIGGVGFKEGEGFILVTNFRQSTEFTVVWKLNRRGAVNITSFLDTADVDEGIFYFLLFLPLKIYLELYSLPLLVDLDLIFLL